jgi:hypothetical protein
MRLAIISIAALALLQFNPSPNLDTSKAEPIVSNFISQGIHSPKFVDRSKEAQSAHQQDIQREQVRVAALQAAEQAKQAQVVNTPIQPQTTPKTPVNVPDDIYMQLAYCESGARWDYNGSSGYDGAFQFSPGTWSGMGTAYAYAYLAPPEVQIDAAKRLIARSGWSQFPLCAKKLGML